MHTPFCASTLTFYRREEKYFDYRAKNLDGLTSWESSAIDKPWEDVVVTSCIHTCYASISDHVDYTAGR